MGVADDHLVMVFVNVRDNDGLEVPNQARAARGTPMPSWHGHPEHDDVRRPSAFVLIRATHGRRIAFGSLNMT